MAKFTSKTESRETAILGLSGGEVVHGDSMSGVSAAVAGVQLNIDPHSTGNGIYGESRGGGAGVFGLQLNPETVGPGVYGESRGSGAGVSGLQPNPATAGNGVYGESRGGGAGVYGESRGSGPGVIGVNDVTTPNPGGPGGEFRSNEAEGIIAKSSSRTQHAIHALQMRPNGTGYALYAEHAIGVDGQKGNAGFFEGNVVVTGDIAFPGGGDCAEQFTIAAEGLADPGTVMALNESGELVPCLTPYDNKVVGVVAGAGTHRPAIILDSQDITGARRQPIALVGKVFCKVDATYGSIKVGDLLTSSATNGHAMKACDTSLAFGAVIGKAMESLTDGIGLIRILISLQ